MSIFSRLADVEWFIDWRRCIGNGIKQPACEELIIGKNIRTIERRQQKSAETDG